MITIKGDFLSIMSKYDERLRLRNKIVTEGRAKLDRSIKNGTYVEWLKKEHGVIDMDDILLDKEFLNDMKKEIERTRKRNIVYDKDYKEFELNEWRRKTNRRKILREVYSNPKMIKLKTDEEIESDGVN